MALTRKDIETVFSDSSLKDRKDTSPTKKKKKEALTRKDIETVFINGPAQSSDEYFTISEEEASRRNEERGGTNADWLIEALKKQNSIPELEPMAELPMPEGEQARLAKRRSLLKQKRRRGRESTILSSPVSLLSEEIGV